MEINYPYGRMKTYKRRPVFRRFKRHNKYHNHKIIADGHKFDSKVEYDYYLLLKAEGKTFKVHQKFEILPHYDNDGIKCRKRNYTPDFVLYHGNIEDNKPYEVVDIKGVKKIPSYDTLRFSLFERRYHVPVVIIRKKHDRWIRQKKMF